METNEIQLLRKAQLMIADEIVRICDKHNIRYFLDSGSMLGAVRHKGFIPWDDDIDIGMVRDDYEKFILIAPKELEEKFFLDNYATNADNALVFSKIRLRNTICIEKKGNSDAEHNEVFVDVFPYYYISNREFVRRIEGMTMAILAQALMSKSGYKVWKGDGWVKRLRFIPTDIIGFLFSKERMHKWVDALFYRYEYTERMGEQGGSGYDHLYFPSSAFNEFVEVPFEDRMYKIPKEYDLFLRGAYGDYMKLPPKEQRVTHSIQKLDVSYYEDIL